LGWLWSLFPVLSGWQLATMISPIFVYTLLTKISGIPLLERMAKKKWGSDPEFIAYNRINAGFEIKKASGLKTQSA
jgi:steroid 5-alpha reductase family enzyme